tara:strand:+ start:414 stop:557 length:144 start_codon:yes stop_codon:yes gene_type:complete
MDKIVLTEYCKDKANAKRIAELEKNINLYKSEINRWEQELADLKEGK